MPGTQADATDMVATLMGALRGLPPYVVKMVNKAADLITEQQVEIEQQQATVERLEREADEREYSLETERKLRAQLKAAREGLRRIEPMGECKTCLHEGIAGCDDHYDVLLFTYKTKAALAEMGDDDAD